MSGQVIMSTKRPELFSISAGGINDFVNHAVTLDKFDVVYNTHVPTAQVFISGYKIITSPYNDWCWDYYYSELLNRTRRELKNELAVMVGAVRALLGLPPA
jgi:hypothetical protein